MDGPPASVAKPRVFMVAVTRPAVDTSVLPAAAGVLGMATPDLVRKLAGPFPRVLTTLADADAAARATAGLEALGFAPVLVDSGAVAASGTRVFARTLRWEEECCVVTAEDGAETTCRWSEIELIQRAVFVDSVVDVDVTRTREFSLSRSLLSGGLVNRRNVEQRRVDRRESREAVLVLHRHDEEPDLVLSEARLDFRFLGAEMVVAGFPNLERTLARLRARLPAVPVEDRVARPGFVAGLPQGAISAPDLALYLVRAARRLANPA